MTIHTLDLNFQNRPATIASYLILGPTGPVLVETGPGSTLPALLERLAERGFSPPDIQHILVTHIHLDHAGAAGWWAQQGAQVYVHQVGAPHLIDPSKLLTSARRIYGDDLEHLWGAVLPAPAERITPVYDGDRIEVAGVTFRAIDTPGHAYHHHTYQLGDIAFTGDAGGIQIPGIDFTDLPAPPPEFNLDLWLQTLDRLLGLPLTAIYPTHFGLVTDWQGQLRKLRALMLEATDFIKTRLEAGLEREAILADYMAAYRQRAQAAGMTEEIYAQYEAANPHFMSVDGIMRYWKKRLNG